MSNPLIYFGAVTGNPTREQIFEALRLYHENGMDDLILYPRDGCEVPYMSEAFLEVCRHYVECASSLGMRILLYDEYNWPSGTCGGEVQRTDPSFCGKYLTKDGQIRVNPKTADLLNPAAVDCFIEKTHEVYYRRFGRYFGSVITGIFSDEPSFAHAACENGSLPYNEDAAALYRERYGRELTEEIRAGKDVSNEWYAILGERFREVFLSKIRTWCDAHGILMTGHLLGEGEAASSARDNGNIFRCLRTFSMPGIDEIQTDTGIGTTQLLTYGSLQAAVRKTGKEGLCELFALGPTDLPLSRLGQMILLVSLFGVSRYTLAIAPLDLRGNLRKSGYCFPLNYLQPWFPAIKDLAAEAEIAASYARKEIRTEVGVLVRFAVCADEKGEKEITPKVNGLLSLLTKGQYQWVLLDEDDPTDGLTVLDPSEEGFSPEAAISALPQKKDRVTNPDGSAIEEIILREYADGTAVVLDLRDGGEEREILFGGKRYRLSPRGHVFFPSEQERYAFLGTAADRFEITCLNENTLRCNFGKDGDGFVFTCEKETRDLRLLVRDFGFDGHLTLDGKPVSAVGPCTTLPKGMRELYRQTAPYTLSEGRHTVVLDKRTRSEPFLPSCLLCGAFSASEDDVIRPLPKTVGTGRLDTGALHQYTGILRFECNVTVPVGAAIRLDCFGQYARLLVDGEDLGGRYAGYVWDIPEKYYGKTVRLTVLQYTSLGPVFGRTKDVVRDGDGEWWAPLAEWFPGRYEVLGIGKAEFVKKV